MPIPALTDLPRRVEVCAGIDEAQLRAAWTLHTAQAAEKGLVFDGEAWAVEVAGKIRAGTWNVGIAWDGERAVGVTEMHLEYDSMRRETIAWGQRAYVLPEYRNADVFTALFECGSAISVALGVKAHRCYAETDWYGQAMKKFYESRGFRVQGYLMERTL